MKDQTETTSQQAVEAMNPVSELFAYEIGTDEAMRGLIVLTARIIRSGRVDLIHALNEYLAAWEGQTTADKFHEELIDCGYVYLSEALNYTNDLIPPMFPKGALSFPEFRERYPVGNGEPFTEADWKRAQDRWCMIKPGPAMTEYIFDYLEERKNSVRWSNEQFIDTPYAFLHRAVKRYKSREISDSDK